MNASASVRLSNKDLRRVADEAVRRGWNLEPGKGHHTLRNGHHRITVASSPSDRNAHHHFARRIRKCEAGTCAHGAPGAEVGAADERAERLAADRARNERKLKEVELTMTNTPVARKAKPIDPKVKGKGGRTAPKLAAATGFVKRYLAEHGPTEHPDLLIAGVLEGHAEGTMRKAIGAAGARIERRGPKRPALVHHSLHPTPAPAPEPDPIPPAAEPRSLDRAAEREWARLEGMAEALGNDALIGQVAKLKAIVGEGCVR